MNKRLQILLLASALMMLAGGLFGPIYAIFVEEIGGDLLTAGTAYSVFAISAGVLIFFISKWEDRVKHKEKLIIVGYGLSALGFLGYLFVERPWHLFVIQAVFGIGEAIARPAYDGLYSYYLDKGKYASEWGTWESVSWIVYGIAAALGGLLANLYGFKLLFLLMFLISLAGMLTVTLLSTKHKEKGNPKKSRKKKI